ncbi:unnamed protein product [Didymodactylos carnosus]|uniref:Uncharacterized protein n=1 Tax=Didymodactylos carnosus TaxID=1234261 RepID=A0A8S2NLJ4_9BILA|nr:unnamed protein product [Didymodactylos carnosus]CAF4008110.1 unnamed protein product [Didymodactylos carnosus]
MQHIHPRVRNVGIIGGSSSSSSPTATPQIAKDVAAATIITTNNPIDISKKVNSPLTSPTAAGALAAFFIICYFNAWSFRISHK